MKTKTTAAIALSLTVLGIAICRQASFSQQSYAPWPPANGGYAPPANGGYAPPANGGYAPPANGGYAPPANGGYAPPANGGYAPPANGGYAPPANGGYAPPANRAYAPPANAGYAPGGSAAAPYPPGVSPPPAGNYQPTWQPIPGTTAPRYNPPPSRPVTSAPGGNPGLEQLIPNFTGPLPQVPPSMQGPAPPGPGFASGWAPAAQPPGSPQEQRCARLEQSAFGATYPEHEVDDRVEHLEREVFGQSQNGDLDSRLSKLEAKLAGGGAFGRSAPPVPPNMPPRGAAGSMPPVAPSMVSMPGPGMQPQVAQSPLAAMQPAANNMQPPPPAVPEAIVPQTAVQQRYQPPGSQPASEKQSNSHSPVKEKPKAQAPPAKAAAKPAPAQPLPATPAPTAAAPTGDAGLQRGQLDTAVQSMPGDPKAGDYFSAMQVFSGGSYARWSQFPIRVHLPMNTPPNWQAALDSAIRQWSKAVPILVNSPEEPADIEVAWINHLQPKQLGITNLEVFNGRMRVTVYLLRPDDYPKGIPAEQRLPAVAAHELGHALGLWGHSQTAGDIMHPLDTDKSKATVVTARDINTLKRVYQAPGLAPGYQSPQPVGWP